ncbi:BrnT family toxin [Desulfovirgula thermocuniculi]|uniref:BrnT family toxin n=1 Tax=Desulfovirgula thermocuniculi TaxID=348842 RepID=UPI00055895EE|nr:BrnT family toxin [Desulfovirgula thermocuniculi]
MRVKRFEWDSRNVGHIARHNVKPGEVEEVFLTGPLIRKARSGLKVAMGRTDAGRYLFVVFALKPGNVVRVITARDMSASERRYYRRERGE